MESLSLILTKWHSGTMSTEELKVLKEYLKTPEGRSDWVHESTLSMQISECLSMVSAASETQEELKELGLIAKGKAFKIPRVSTASSSRPFAYGVLAVALILLSFTFLFIPGFQAFNNSQNIAQVEVIDGPVTLFRLGHKLELKSSSHLKRGDQLTIPQNSALVFSYADGSRFECGPGASLVLGGDKNNKYLFLSEGSLYCDVQSQLAPLIVESPQAEVKVLGTQFLLKASSQESVLNLYEGKVEFNNRQGKSKVLQASQQIGSRNMRLENTEEIQEFKGELIELGSNYLKLDNGLEVRKFFLPPKSLEFENFELSNRDGLKRGSLLELRYKNHALAKVIDFEEKMY